jgi:hypothetical protein
MTRTITLAFLFIALLVSGCAVNRLSSNEFQEAKTEIVRGSYDEVFTSTVSALRSKGFHINEIDRIGGEIVALYRFAPGRELEGEFFEGYRQRFALGMRADVIVKPIDDDQVLIDLTFIEELPPSASTYTIRPEDLTYREVRTGQQYAVMFNTIKSRLGSPGP